MKRKAKELQAARLAAAKGKPTARSSMTGFGGNGKSNDSSTSVEITPAEPVVSKPSRPARFGIVVTFYCFSFYFGTKISAFL